LKRDLQSILRHERILPPLMTACLKAVGLFHRGRQNALRPALRRLRFEFENLPSAFHGYRILHLSDLHVDSNPALVDIVADCLRDIDADLCVLTGDYRLETVRQYDSVYESLARLLGSVRARDGIVGVLGNHDFSEDIGFLQSIGVRVLMNQAHCVTRQDSAIWIAGVDDPHTYFADNLEEALSEVPPESFKMLLAHSPELIEEAAMDDVALYLCGHTHGGQFCLPWLPKPLLLNARCQRRFARGVWRHGKLQGYTSSGVGTSLLPVRFHCPPEIGLIELACGPALGGRRAEPVAAGADAESGEPEWTLNEIG
jgi:predicted MPP superfamily phosphohydrolase